MSPLWILAYYKKTMKEIKAIINGKDITFNEYCDSANYGTDINLLRSLGWQAIKFKHLAEIFKITEEEAKEAYKNWRGY